MKVKDRLSWLLTCSTKQRAEYYQAVVELGCMCCGAPYTPEGKNYTSFSHCVGKSQWPSKRIHRPGWGACYHDCHMYGDMANNRPSIHGQQAAFEEMYGTQMELVEKTEKMLQGGW